MILGVILAAGVRALRIGGHHGDLIGLAGAAAAVYWHAGLALVPLCIALGAAAHIAGDELTHDGCPLAWPVSGQEFHLLPRRLQITTGRFAEHWIVSTLLLAGLGYLLWRDTGIAGVMNHLHLPGGRSVTVTPYGSGRRACPASPAEIRRVRRTPRGALSPVS